MKLSGTIGRTRRKNHCHQYFHVKNEYSFNTDYLVEWTFKGDYNDDAILL